MHPATGQLHAQALETASFFWCFASYSLTRHTCTETCVRHTGSVDIVFETETLFPTTVETTSRN